jgi:hypothetical protein
MAGRGAYSAVGCVGVRAGKTGVGKAPRWRSGFGLIAV